MLHQGRLSLVTDRMEVSMKDWIKAAFIVVMTSLAIMLGSLGLAVMSDTSCEEDQPCWNCHTMGTRVCGEPRR